MKKCQMLLLAICVYVCALSMLRKCEPEIPSH